jgi:hypothetical protein
LQLYPDNYTYMRKGSLIVILAMSCIAAFAQSENEYRSKNNGLYWKNRQPDKDYWQQDVLYKIDARIDEDNNTITATEKLEYWNNSPDTLHFVYFHLYQNAFIKGSHLHALENANKTKTKMGKYEAEGKGIIIEDITANGKDVSTELDNTILKISLPQPLYPGSKVNLSMKFMTYYDKGATRRRMQMWDAWGFKHYNGCQWFPKMCVYDRKFGWDTYQHLNREFYGDFGLYDVSLDFPSNYVVEASGVLQNRKEMLPDTLRKKLDIKNFANKKWDEAPSIITPYKKGERKIWKFKANNVHDFAFTADPSYRIATAYWKDIECVGIVQEPHASGWQNSANYVVKIIKTFSEDFGMYQYPKMVAADARDGMEYPMLTLDGGSDPGYRGLLVHEIAHNWFYGMIGNNETYRAALDEGFTQFATAWGLRRIDGDTLVEEKPKWLHTKLFKEPEIIVDRRVYNAYLYDALNKEELPLNTHSDDFQGALGHDGGYRGVYYKTATMLYNLQYVLGDSLFLAAMQHYFHQWRFAHPYFEDFRNSIIQFTNVDLNWFFDQWLETTKTIDYRISNIKKVSDNNSFAIKFRRTGEMQMPIDFTVTAKDGSKQEYHIPNTWFNKSTNAVVLPKWYGWGRMHNEYTAHVNVPSGISMVQIDPSYRLADIYIMDNYKSRGLPFSPKALAVKLDGGLAAPWDRRHNRAYMRPDVWWNPIDGVKLGVHLEGDYLFSMHKVDATLWWNTGLLQDSRYNNTLYPFKTAPLNYTFNYLSPLNRRLPKLQLQINSRLLDGLWYHRGGFNWLVNGNNKAIGYVQTMWRPVSYGPGYQLYTSEWSSTNGLHNTSLNLAWSHSYKYMRGNGNYTFSLRAPLLTGNSGGFNYSYAQFEAINYNQLHKLEIRTRLFARYGQGANVPYESMLFAAGANPEELVENKYTRTVGFVPDSWRTMPGVDINHFQQGGGLNLRGYAGYYVAEPGPKGLLVGYKGRSGAATNIEIDFDNYIRFRPKLVRHFIHIDLYGFADAGIIELSSASLGRTLDVPANTEFSSLRVDAGFGSALTITNWMWFNKAKPLTLRFDMPLFVNKPPFVSPDFVKFRYVVGVNRTF